MGIKVFRRTTLTHDVAFAKSDIQADRLARFAELEPGVTSVERGPMFSVSITREYKNIAGNWEDDDDSWRNRLEKKAGVNVTWAERQRNRCGDVPRAYEEVLRSVLRSKYYPNIQLEGSAAVSATPYRRRLKEEGWI